MDRSNISFSFVVSDPSGEKVPFKAVYEYEDVPYDMLIGMQEILTQASEALLDMGRAKAKVKREAETASDKVKEAAEAALHKK